MPIPSRICRLLAIVALVSMSSAWAASASAAVAWHPDIATARRASEVSHRPVLAIFTASWSSASTTLDRTTLASDEAVALITACFEPVCVDVDESPEATRRLGISKVPTACILTADDQVLSKFELPETPAGFVAAAARAAQEAAFASAAASRSQSANATVESASGSGALTDISASKSGELAPFWGENGKPRQVTARAGVQGTVPPGGQAINVIAAKVRRLSDFASDDASPAVSTNPAIAAAFRESPSDQVPATPVVMPRQGTSGASLPAPPANVAAKEESAPVATDTAATTRTAGPATVAFVASTPSATGSAAGTGNFTPGGQGTQSPLAIEPVPSAPSNTTAGSASWLGAPQQNQSASAMPAAPAPATAAIPPATSAPQTTADAGPSTPEQSATGAATALAETKPEKPASATASLLAAIQKPFSMFAKPAAPKSTAKSTPKSTTTPATASPEAAVATAAPAEPDTYGSMPVGLEGYCPVTLAERGAWVEGRAQWGVRHRGRTYLFAGVEQQQAFLADPDRYAPALSGDDPVLAFDAGKSTPGQRRYGVTYQSRTYLFTSPQTRDAFAANPQRYTSGAMVAENRTPTNGPVVR